MKAGSSAARLEFLVGGRSAKALSRGLGITTVDQLLRHYPRRYAERGSLTDLSRLRVDDHVTVLARVVSATVHDYRDRRKGRTAKRTEVVVTDGTEKLTLIFFRQPYLVRTLHPGVVGLFAGQVSEFRRTRQLLHPDYHLFGSTDPDDDPAGKVDVDLSELEGVRPLIPVYPATASLSSWRIASAIELVLDQLGGAPDEEDPLPARVRQQEGLLPLAQAWDQIHRPRSHDDHRRARDRFVFEEAFVVQTALALRRHDTAELPAQPRPPVGDGLREQFQARLPFELTHGQRDVGEVIGVDLSHAHPMHRLLQGEVGSGKTVVALIAMLQVVDAGGQAALLAPTEVLAQQHHRSITAMLGDLAAGGMLGGADEGTRVALLTGSLGAAARRQALLDAASGTAGIVVGTHALLEERVGFADLGMVVVDEQHRFGVEQRAALTAKASGNRPHVLVMTATPIPRTVAMTVFGDLETSTMRELPSGRQPIQTTVVPVLDRPAWVDRTWARIGEEVARGRQAYVVCTRIGDADEPEEPVDDERWGLRLVPDLPGEPLVNRRPTRAVHDVHAELKEGPLAGLRVEMLHGRMTPDAKDEVMTAFAAGQVDVLVATTVVEVGVDVPNATVMVIMDPDRFGVSQIHQLRGRVGRGTEPGLCLLVTEAPAGSAARDRLDAVAASSDGFELSQLDVRLRREGDVLGASQSGSRSSLRLLSVLDDEEVIVVARAAAGEAVETDPTLSSWPALRRLVAEIEGSERGAYLDKT